MLMEGRKPQQACKLNGKKACSPKQTPFITKFNLLATRAAQIKSVSAFYRHCVKMWKRYLSRRSQRAKLDWEKYMKILKDNPLIKPHLPHSVYKLT